MQFSCMRLLPRMLGVEAQVGIRMKDFGEWKPLLNKTSHVLPRHPALLTATLYHSQPTFAHLKSKALETGEISRNGMEVEVASNHALQPLPDFRQIGRASCRERM